MKYEIDSAVLYDILSCAAAAKNLTKELNLILGEALNTAVEQLRIGSPENYLLIDLNKRM